MKRLPTIIASLCLIGTFAAQSLAAESAPTPKAGRSCGCSACARSGPRGSVRGCGFDRKELGKQLSIYTVIPFVIILLAIAVLPLLTPLPAESNLVEAVISVLLALIMGAYLVSLGYLESK